MQRELGCCYYPEHWPASQWQDDARRMRAAGLSWVRIGEFAWGRIEPEPGCFQWQWLDQAVAVLHEHGLRVVLGTPTATPPKWVVDRHPDMLPVTAQGRVLGFGSRRHYCFSHVGFREESRRITEAMAQRYGRIVQAWQTDNEYGCHDSTLSYSDSALRGFRAWLQEQYSSIDALNTAWGNVFWSMEYQEFNDIGLPMPTVADTNPMHQLAFRRYTSDQVVAFNRSQVDAIRAHSDAPISHNFMGRITDFDHFAVGQDLDIATWDSYPLGFLEDRVGADAAQQRQFARQGDPDFQAFHHDLYRAVGRGRWWVMEQQPGPVNWAPYNPAPLPGMVRLWTWEAFAHGAEVVSYFRWRQCPFGAELMHSGLLRPDGEAAQGLLEAQTVAQELRDAPAVQPLAAQVGIVFDYDADAAWAIQPHGQGMSYFGLVFDTYKALRRMGLNVDILGPNQRDFNGYEIVLLPGMIHMPEALKTALDLSGALVVVGPRADARDAQLRIPTPLGPQLPGLDTTVSYVESLRPDLPIPLTTGHAVHYREHLDGSAEALLQDHCASAVVVREQQWVYCGAWLDAAALDAVLRPLCDERQLRVYDLPPGLRRRETLGEEFWFNYNDHAVHYASHTLPAAGVLRRDK